MAHEPIATERVQTPSVDPRDARLQRALDAFRAAMTPTYRTPNGDVNVSAAFRMNGVPVEKPATELEAVARRAHIPLDAVVQCRLGRGNPEQIRTLTQALIDQGKLAPKSGQTLKNAVRDMMQEYGVGVDCAGYVQQAYLHATGVDRGRTHFRSLDNDDLSGSLAAGTGESTRRRTRVRATSSSLARHGRRPRIPIPIPWATAPSFTLSMWRPPRTSAIY